MKQQQAQIFLSDNRVVEQNASFRSYSTITTAHTAVNELTTALYLLNDVEIAPKESKSVHIAHGSCLILLPITGDVIMQGPKVPQEKIDVGEIRILSLDNCSEFQFKNPFHSGVINYLELQICGLMPPLLNELLSFDLRQDRLIELNSTALPFSINLGRFTGRCQSGYSAKKQGSTVICFVIAGAFEVEDRLLQMRDTLVLTTAEMEFEALSDQAILLIIELFGH